MPQHARDTVLDTPETNGSLGVWPVEPPESYDPGPLHPFAEINDTLCQTFRHSGWKHDRQRVIDSLIRTFQPQPRCTAFSHCGSHAYILKSTDDPPQYRVAGSTCHDRYCVPCATERSRIIAMNVLEKIGTTRVRFITLTLKQTDIGLSASIDRLLASFRKLQKLPDWKKHVTAGVGFMEVKLNPDTRYWNVHLHLIATGKYIPRDTLSSLWHRITGDSFVVHVMLPKGHRHVVKYVTKYASKPLNTSFSHDTAALDEAVVALKGRRLCTTWGGWRGILLTGTPCEDAWENIGSLDSWLCRANDGDSEALTVVAAIDQAQALPLWENRPASPHPPPPETPTTAHRQLSLPGMERLRTVIGF